MRKSPPSICLSLAALIAMTTACADGAETDTSAMDAGAPAAEVTPAPTPAEMVPMTARLEPVGDSGVAGDVTITERPDQTEVAVRLTGAAPGTSHPGHIHSGSCAEIGAVVQPLEPVATDAGGAGSATSTAPLPAATAMDGRHIVVYHGEGGAPVTCAQIPAHSM